MQSQFNTICNGVQTAVVAVELLQHLVVQNNLHLVLRNAQYSFNLLYAISRQVSVETVVDVDSEGIFRRRCHSEPVVSVDVQNLHKRRFNRAAVCRFSRQGALESIHFRYQLFCQKHCNVHNPVVQPLVCNYSPSICFVQPVFVYGDPLGILFVCSSCE